MILKYENIIYASTKGLVRLKNNICLSAVNVYCSAVHYNENSRTVSDMVTGQE